MKAKLPKNIILALTISGISLGCGKEYKASYRLSRTGGAEAKTDVKRIPVNFKLPSRSEDPALTTALTGYYYRLQGSGEHCPSGELKEDIGAYEDDKEFILRLSSVCDYSVTIKLGELASPAFALGAKLNYNDSIKDLIGKNCVACHESYGNYAEVVAKGDLIIARAESGTMPPTGSLSSFEIAQLLAWKDEGYIEKDPSPQPSARENGLKEVYYRNNNNDSLKGVELLTRTQYELRRSLWLQAEGEEKGLKVNEILSFGQEDIKAP